ncbi:flavin reductase family protein [Nocardioides sp. Root151]|uniref:flavin reductase family protein n=1 Tax=Nocardioides sp. Root151 TaxID=1736475 RepID=UPI000703835D|nr:flavin reductase family protein [Nocardioides sp. Root151]KQZ69851.1 flavin reductase [Nocardioides sp. Root151]
MTIHREHPFLEPPGERDPIRRLRGRLGGQVTLWTSGSPSERAGLTVSSLMVAAGQPGRVLGLIDPDSDLMDLLADSGTAAVSLLHYRHHNLADIFAGTVPAPGGQFTQLDEGVTWTDTEWGPVLSTVTTWVGVHVESVTEVGWSNLVTATVEHAVIGDDGEPLVHRRGRYQHAH